MAIAYIANKKGYDVTDFRGGESRFYFSNGPAKYVMPAFNAKFKDSETTGLLSKKAIKLLKTMEVGKEYYCVYGKHAAITRKTSDGKIQYLELQSSDESGWVTVRSALQLRERFGGPKCPVGFKKDIFKARIAPIDDMVVNEHNSKIFDYINTKTDEQQKGSDGYEK